MIVESGVLDVTDSGDGYYSHITITKLTSRYSVFGIENETKKFRYRVRIPQNLSIPRILEYRIRVLVPSLVISEEISNIALPKLYWNNALTHQIICKICTIN